MGYLLQDLYEYKGYRINEVCIGSYIHNSKRKEKKHEKTIYKAVELAEESNKTIHIALQKFNTFLAGRSSRDDNEASYFPFTIEIEPNIHDNGTDEFYSKYQDSVTVANSLCWLLECKYEINREDIVVFINNSRSIYITVNPKCYRLVPGSNLYLIYNRIWEVLSSELQDLLYDRYINVADFIDSNTSFSKYRLIKCPNTYYKGGYVVNVSLDELQALADDIKLKRELTSKRRRLDKEIPGEYNRAFHELYLQSSSELKGFNNSKFKRRYNDNNVVNLSDEAILRQPVHSRCVEYMIKYPMPIGMQNQAIVSVSIYYYNQGLSAEALTNFLYIVVSSWPSDGSRSLWSMNHIKKTVNSVYRNKTNFSCDKVNSFANFGIEGCCSYCIYNASFKKDEFAVYSVHVRALFSGHYANRKLGLRHYYTYLKLCRYSLFNKYFCPDDYGIDIKTFKEVISVLKLNIQYSGNLLKIDFSVPDKGLYYIPLNFMDKEYYKLPGQRLKHYLLLLVLGYSHNKNSLQISQKKDTLLKLLGFKDISSYNKLLKFFVDIGLVKIKSDKSIYLYYEPYKVIDITSKKTSVKIGLKTVSNTEANIKRPCMSGTDNRHIYGVLHVHDHAGIASTYNKAPASTNNCSFSSPNSS